MRIPEWIGGQTVDGSKIAVAEGYSLPFSDEFRAYIDAGIMQLNDDNLYNLDIGVTIDAEELLKEIIDSLIGK